MACVAPKGRSAPSCMGYSLGDESNDAKVLCPYCRKIRQQANLSLNAQKTREADRVAQIKALSKRKDLTGASLQKQVTAVTEQVLIDLFEDCSRGGTPPADFALMTCGSGARREMVTFSDIDAVLVLSNEDTKTMHYFEDLTTRMSHRLQAVGTRVTMEEGRPFVGNSGFVFCPGGGLSPTNYRARPETIIDEIVRYSADDAHLRGALFPRLVYGSPIWAKQYTDMCEKALKTGAGSAKQAALRAIAELMPRKNSDLKQARKGDVTINLKTSIYRAAQLIPNELAIYYGVVAMGTREQIVKLVEGRHMSPEVANIFMETLESYAKVMTAVQLKAGQEQHTVRTRDLPTSDPDSRMIKLNAEQLASIESCLPRIDVIWKMGDGFLAQKSKKGIFASKKNPFMSTNPWQEMCVSRS